MDKLVSMNSAKVPAFNRKECYDECLVANSLKKLFAKVHSKKSAPNIVLSKRIAEMKDEVERLNKEEILELSYPYLATMEQSMPDTEFRYACIIEENEPVLFVYFQLCTLTSKNFRFDKNKGFAKGLFRFFLRLHKLKVLFSGNVVRSETAFYCYSDRHLNNTKALELAAAIGEKIASEECVSGVILESTSDSVSVKKWLASKGYSRPWQDNVMVMDIDARWNNLDHYVGDLSRKYKTRANKILASGSELEVRTISTKEITERKEEIYRLFKNVVDNQSFVLARLGVDHFIKLKKVYGADFEVNGFFLEGKLVAFYSAFLTDDAYDVYYVGLDYELNSKYQLYFNLLYACLMRAIDLKKQQLKLGRTSFDAKATLGAKPKEMNYFIKTANIPDVIIGWFANYFSAMEDGQWKLRNPLKMAV